MRSNDKRGLTLIELLVSLSFVAIIIVLAATMLNFSNKSQVVIGDEFQLQSQMRIAAETLNQEVRYSTAVFLMNENQFRSSSDLKNEWNYVALSDDKSEIIHYIWDSTLRTHKRNVLVGKQNELSYHLKFSGSTEDPKIVNFILDGYTSNSSNPKSTITTALNAVNSVVVDDSGTLISPAYVLAYRSDETPTPDNLKVAVTLVLDESGSMAEKMGGSSEAKDELRTNVLKEQAIELIDLFQRMSNVHVSIVPFSNNANGIKSFVKVEGTASEELKTQINNLKTDGGTNAGDGIRRSYYQHKAFNTSNATSQVLNYTIILMDGNPTYYVRRNSTNYYGNVAVGSKDGGVNIAVSGNGGESEDNMNSSLSYINSLAKEVILKNTTSPQIFMRTFVVGLNGNQNAVDRAQSVAQYHNHPTDDRIVGKYYAATSKQELKEAFTSIADYILKETWHIYGPLK